MKRNLNLKKPKQKKRMLKQSEIAKKFEKR